MKTICFSLLLLGFLSQTLFAQSRFYVRNGCGVDDAEMGQNHYVFDPSDEAVQIIGIIMDANALPTNFAIKSGDVDNALATVDNGNRYIIYNTAYVERIKNSAGTDWAAYFVFAHEIGHHLSNHRFDLTDPVKSKEQELQADLFAGGMLYRLGASLEEAQAGVGSVCKERESNTHPPRRARMEAVASGWKKIKDKSGGVQPKRVTLPGNTARPNNAAAQPDNMVLVKGGTFQIGSNAGDDDEKPVHSVTVSDFYIGRYEVTQAEWRKVMGSDPLPLYFKSNSRQDAIRIGFGSDLQLNKKGCDQCPVERVSWNDVQEFLQKLNVQTGKRYRLPTEAEWEYAARGGSKRGGYQYAGSDNLDEVAWYGGNSGAKTDPVGQKKANELGLYDMSGNVWEWCSDWYGAYASGSQNNPKGAVSGDNRVIRGGGWGTNARNCRVSDRNFNTPTYRFNGLGFRLVLQ